MDTLTQPTQQTLDQLIAASGLKRRWLAEQVDVNRDTLTRWAAGRTEPSSYQLLRLARVLNRSVEDVARAVAASRHAFVAAQEGELP